MPKVLSYTPDWLSRPSPGYNLFAPKQLNGSSRLDSPKPLPGPQRTIATRDSEVFVAVGHELRWADLADLKDGVQPAYRTLKVSIPLPITRLTLSPGGDYLAVSTSHTVHVVVLPSASLLDSDDDSPIKPRTFQVGPTTHVLEESPVATTLWHPLGYHGRCLVTITKSGVVRLWEVNRADRSSFGEPSLSIDLPKLANATSDQDDLSASKFGVSKGFSPDSVELEVASACFGDSPDQEGVHGWAPMTLWIATIPGDVYALCPLLPSKWQLVESPGAFTFLQTLTSSINITYAELSEDDDVAQGELKTAEKQVSWLSDILYEEPFVEELPTGDSIKVFARPKSAPAVPLLQGPFTITPEVDFFELSDMIVFSLKTLSESSEAEAAEGLPTAVVCLLTDTCTVHVCLDLEGIVGRWLPSPEDNIDITDTADHDLIIAESVVVVQNAQSSFNQSITPDVHTDFTFFVSHSSGVSYISLEPWVRKLEVELSEPQPEGSEFRIKRVLASANSYVDQYLQRRPATSAAEESVNAVAVIEDGNVGYMLLTTVDGEPQAAILDAPEDGLLTEEELAEYMAIVGPTQGIREIWQPPKVFYEPFDLLGSINISSRHRGLFQDEIKLSPANLELLMEVHRALSVQTSKLQHAVSDLFTRATRLQEEFRDQVLRTSHIASNIDNVTGAAETASENGSVCGSVKIDERLEKVRNKQNEITARYESLRRKMALIGSSEMNEKEAIWVEELSAMEGAIDASNASLTQDVDGSDTPAWRRLDKLKETQKNLRKEVAEASKLAAAKEENREPSRQTNLRVPSHSRKAENDLVQETIQRNSVLVQAATDKLRRLGISIPRPAENVGT